MLIKDEDSLTWQVIWKTSLEWEVLEWEVAFLSESEISPECIQFYNMEESPLFAFFYWLTTK